MYTYKEILKNHFAILKVYSLQVLTSNKMPIYKAFCKNECKATADYINKLIDNNI